MIQRIQTLWLAFIILITIATFFFPIVDFSFSFKSMNTIQQYGLMKPESSPDSFQFIQTTSLEFNIYANWRSSYSFNCNISI